MTPPLTTHLTTDRLTLRRPEPQDFDAYRAYYTGPRTAFVGGPLSAARVFERFCAMIGHWNMRGFGRYTIVRREDGARLGHVGPMQLTDDALPEMTWTLWSGAHEGRGFAGEAAQAVLEQLWQTGWTEMIARVSAANARSCRIAERLGGQLCPGAEAPDAIPDAVTYRFARPESRGDAA